MSLITKSGKGIPCSAALFPHWSGCCICFYWQSETCWDAALYQFHHMLKSSWQISVEKTGNVKCVCAEQIQLWGVNEPPLIHSSPLHGQVLFTTQPGHQCQDMELATWSWKCVCCVQNNINVMKFLRLRPNTFILCKYVSFKTLYVSGLQKLKLYNNTWLFQFVVIFYQRNYT